MRTNRLAREKSPYLLQHAQNPVDWFAWNDEAFAKARAENKPIFLSIGYSTCHWCHVMERESFEQANIGAYLNEHFVSIKVDREERPDVDKIYMTFVQSTTGSGGWPMSVFLTPDLKPFFGGTYFPPDARYGRPSFLQLLQQISQLWQERREELAASAEEIHAKLELKLNNPTSEDLLLNAEVVRRAGAMFKEAYEPQHGGFGGAPKFPQPSIPSLVLRHAKRFNDEAAATMVLHTCNAMAAGGIHDQLGGGFARYSVDAEWLVPHFEKMLYDNAQLAQLYLDAFLISDDARHAGTVRDILDYVLRDMTHPDGGFYSAEDADSEGQEGKFYCWTQAELSKLLTVDEFNVAAKYYGITREGNFVDHSHPQPLAGLNVLSVVNPIRSGDSAARRKNADSAARYREADATTADEELLAAAKKKMCEVRATRIRPHLDDKILASWNGLMLGAFARASAVLDDEKYRVAAEKNLSFIQEKLWVGGLNKNSDTSLPLTPALSPRERENRSPSPGKSATASGSKNLPQIESPQPLSPLPGGEGQGEGKARIGTLFHRWRDGERDSVQLLEAYAFLLSGVIDLYEATLAPKHLDFAIELAEAMLAKFYDVENGGFWQSAAGATDLILRVKDDYDGAEPSGNSVATLALLKLGAITGRKQFTTTAVKTLQLFAHRLQNFPQALPFMLHAVDFQLAEPRRVVIAGEVGDAKAKELLHAAHSVYQPNKIILGNVGAVEEFARTLPTKESAVVYLCTGNACQPPTSDATTLKDLLK